MDNGFWGTSAGNRPIRVALTSALALLALFLLVETGSVIQNFGQSVNVSPHTIVVSGEGKVSAIPDTAVINYRITNTAPKVSTAQEETTKTGNITLAILAKEGIEKSNIKTTSYSINPRYEYRPCVSGVCPPAKITGYTVTQSVSVRIHDTKIVGTILSALGSAGVTNLNGPSFTVSDTTALENQARAKAIVKAKAQAALLASQLGVRLVQIVNYTENSSTSPRPFLYTTSMSQKNSPTIPTGENEYVKNVSITYEIQ